MTGRFSTTEVRLQQVGETRFRVLSPVTFERGSGQLFTVPPGEFTDLASVPSFLWGLIASYGRQTQPAILHDHLCTHAEKQPPENRFPDRAVADDLFREALIAQGEPPTRARVMWCGVVFDRYRKYRPWALAWLGPLLVAPSAALLLAAIGHRGWAVTVLAPYLAAMAAPPGTREFVRYGSFSLPVLALTLPVLAAQRLLELPDVIRDRYRHHHGRPDKGHDTRPTLRR